MSMGAALLTGCSSSKAHPGANPAPSSTPLLSTVPPGITAAAVQTVQTTDGTVSYRAVGAGPPLVLVMGYGGSIDDWTPAFLSALARGHRVITPDNAGIGRTTALPTPITVTAMASQLSAFITALHVGRPDVMGWSMGGMIAQALAVEHPDQVDHLVLAATLPGDGHAVLPSAAVVAKLDQTSNPAAVLSLLFPSDQAGQAASRDYVTGILSWPDAYSARPAAERAEQGALAEWTSGSDPAGPKVNTIKTPTLVADGAEDPLAPTGDPQHLASIIPGASLAVYPDSAHGFMFEDQSSFVARMLAFLAAGSAAG